MDLGNGSKKYRVLKVNDTVAECLAMYEYSTSCVFNYGLNNIYANSTLDTTLNTTFYNTLSDTAKAAIVDKNITQYQYSRDISVYNATTHASYAVYSTKVVRANIGNRHIYALDVEDIEEYFGNRFSTSNIWTMFWSTTKIPSTITYPWLRSTRDDSVSAWFVPGNNGSLDDNLTTNKYAARPAFQIDLSRVSWS